MSGIMRIEGILSLLDKLGGTEEDLDKIMGIEATYHKVNPKEEK